MEGKASKGVVELYLPWEVYKNLPKLIEHRKIKTDYKFMDERDFLNNFVNYGYINIKGIRENHHGKFDSHIFLLEEGSKYSNKTQDFRKLFNQINMEKPSEILIISGGLSNTIKKQVELMKREHKEVYLEEHHYAKFAIVIPEHIKVPKHEMLTNEEAQARMDEDYKRKIHYPKILSSDSPVVWLGARPGDMIRIHRLSETSGKAVAYRVVIDG